KRPAAEKKAEIRNSTEWTGLRAETTQSADPILTADSNQKAIACKSISAAAVGEQSLLVVVELLAGLHRVLGVRTLDDGVHRAGLLAEAAVDAFDHVDVVAGRPPAAVLARLCLDGDRLGRADRLAEFAGD